MPTISCSSSLPLELASSIDWLIALSHDYSQHLLGGSFKLKSGIVDNAVKIKFKSNRHF
jgi:hypothetical protein